jgi:predicted amidohydrolase YtcJ
MAQHFHNGAVYVGLGLYTKELFVDDNGLVCDLETYEQSATQDKVELSGAMLVPAFRDTHSHPLFAGREAQGLDITSLHNIPELGNALAQHRAANPALTWLDAAVYDRSMTGSQTRQTLDNYVSDIPVVLHADDHHTLWVNTKALEVAGLMNGSLPPLSAGRIDVNDQGIPTGILREWPAMSLVMDLAPANSLQEDVRALLWAEQQLIQAGIVECQDAWIDRGMAEVYLEAAKQGLLKLDYSLAFRADVEKFTSDFDYFLELRQELGHHKNLKGQAIKFFVDGVFGSATASVSESYLSSDNFGELNWNSSELVSAISLSHANGFQVHIHAIGDAGVAFALDCIAAASARPKGLNPVIAHAELTNPELLMKAKELDVNLCMQPFWAQNNGMLLSCRDHLGDSRLNSLYAIRDMIESGLNVSFSSDWPVSTPSVMQGLTVAVFRQSAMDMPKHNPSQEITLEKAIDAYTSSACKLLGKESLGTLEVGQRFDAVLLNMDLKAEDLDGFLSAKVLATYKAGKNLLV